MINVGPRRVRLSAAVEDLYFLVSEGSASERELVLTYLSVRRDLALAIREVLVANYSGTSDLESARLEFTNAGRQAFPYLPEPLTEARRFGPTHTLIFNYLAAQVGHDVPSEELRILTADAVHTERRARELRDIGLVVQAVDTPRGPGYCLRRRELDLAAPLDRAIRRNITESSVYPAAQRDQWLRDLNS